MSLSSSPSPLPKLPFLIADAAFLAAAALIANSSRHPLDSSAVAGIVVCAVGAAICGAIPFIAEYSRRQETALDDRQRSLEALAQTVATAAEQIGIAASGLNGIAEIAQRNLHEAEKLPQKLAAQIGELEVKFNAARDEDREQLESELATLRASESERLEATAQKIARAATDWAKAESFGLRHVVAAKTFIAELEQKTATLRTVLAEAKVGGGKRGAGAKAAEGTAGTAGSVASPSVSADSGNTPEFNTREAATGASQQLSPSPEAESVLVPARPEVALHLEPSSENALHPKPTKRVAKKAYDPQDAIPGLELPDETAQVSPEEASPPPSTSADGATRLVVTSYIGIGNRLFIRGEGPGLSWDEGVPLQFISIGKWRWETPNATAPVRFKLLKNDRDECSSISTAVLEPGQQQELTATF